MSDEHKPKVKLLSLWRSREPARNGRYYYTGLLGDAQVIMFENDTDNPKAPLFSLYVSENDWKRKRAGQIQAKADHDSGGADWDAVNKLPDSGDPVF
jgi:hypothetical protein